MRTRASGLTILELLLTIAICAVLLAVSMPDLKGFSQSVAGDVTLRRLASAIQFGKSNAITSNTSVTLCRSENGLSCGGNWHDGAIVFTDRNRNREIDDEDLLLRYVSFPDSSGTIQLRAFQNKQYLQLTSLGTTHSQNGNFTYCPFSASTRFARQLILNRTARIRYAVDSDGDGWREDSRGRPLSCE